MHKLMSLLKGFSASTILLSTSIAQAGVGSPIGSFSFTPLADQAPDAGAVAAPVPLLSDALLVALGLLLAVVAARGLQRSRGAQKLMSAAVLGCGLLLGGMGAQDSVSAGFQEMFDIGGDLSCDGFEDQPFELDHEGSSTVTNNCDHGGDIVETFRDERTGEIIEPEEMACGATIGTCSGTLASGASCTLTYQNRCEQ